MCYWKFSFAYLNLLVLPIEEILQQQIEMLHKDTFSRIHSLKTGFWIINMIFKQILGRIKKKFSENGTENVSYLLTVGYKKYKN